MPHIQICGARMSWLIPSTKNGGLKEPYISTLMLTCTWAQDKLDEEHVRLPTPGQMINEPIYSQISYNYCLLRAFWLKLGPNLKIFLVEMKIATGKEITKHVIWPAKVVLSSCAKARCAQLLIIIHRLWKVMKRVEERRERRMVGKRMILELMQVLIEQIESIVFNPYIFVPMVDRLWNT